MKIRAWSLILTYLFCTILICTYLGILFLPPKVCLEYKMYYIDKTLIEWPGYGGLHCDFGQRVLMSNQTTNKNDQHAGQGWGGREENFRWSTGESSKLYFTTEYKGQMLIIFELGELLCSNFNVFINDELVGNSENIDGRFLICEFSDEYAIDNLYEVRFEIFEPVKPSDISTSKDNRELGFQIYSFMLLPNDEFCNMFYDLYDLINNDVLDYELENIIYFGDEIADVYCIDGWAGKEYGFRWTNAQNALCCFHFTNEMPRKIIIQVGNKICDNYNILLNNTMLIEKCETVNDYILLDIPDNVCINNTAKLEIQLNNPQRPCDISDSDDSRLLGLQMVSIEFQ